MPGTNPAEAMRVVAGELPDFPHLPELPDRGPGADLAGRTARLLVEIPVEVTPRGWRLAERPGRDLARARTMLSTDLDVMEEVLDGFRGPLEIELCGPWTLAATLELPRTLNVAIADPGAVADLTASLAKGSPPTWPSRQAGPRRPARRPARRAGPVRRGRRRGADGERAVADRARRGRRAAGAAGPGNRQHGSTRWYTAARRPSRSESSGRRGPTPFPSTSASYGGGKWTGWPRPRRRAWDC